MNDFPFLNLQEVGHDPSQWQLQMDHSRQVHIMPRNLADESDPSKVRLIYFSRIIRSGIKNIFLTHSFRPLIIMRPRWVLQ